MSKIDLAYAPASRAERWNALQLLRFAARALLFALHDSRERAARTIIRDHRHLLPQQAGSNSFQEGCKDIVSESKGKAREYQKKSSKFREK